MKYLALDIGNVCIKINPVSAYSRMGFDSLPPEIISVSRKFESGRLSFDEMLDFFQKHPAGQGFSKMEMTETFISILQEPMPGMEKLITSLPSRGIQPVFFSDISEIHIRKTREMFKAAVAVPCGIYSYQVGFMKPAKEMFRNFEKRFGSPCLYVDDRADLIAAATEYGWNAWQFTSAQDLADKITELDI